MRSFIMAITAGMLAIILTTLPTIALAQSSQCPTLGNDGQYHNAEEGPNWCAIDHGFNEGAECGLRALTGTGIPLPAPVGGQILGNIWDRTNMMGATKAAYHTGFHEVAINAAICCQADNPHMTLCMQTHRSAIDRWLRNH